MLRALTQALQSKGFLCNALKFNKYFSQMLQIKGFFPLKALSQMLQLKGLLSFKSFVASVAIKGLLFVKNFKTSITIKGLLPFISFVYVNVTHYSLTNFFSQKSMKKR